MILFTSITLGAIVVLVVLWACCKVGAWSAEFVTDYNAAQQSAGFYGWLAVLVSIFLIVTIVAHEVLS